MTSTGSRFVLALVVLLFTAPACGLIGDLFDNDDESATESSSRRKSSKTANEGSSDGVPDLNLALPNGLPSSLITGIPNASRLPIGAKFDYFGPRHALTILPKLQERAGATVLAIKIFIHPDHIVADLRDPKDRARVLRHTLRDGGWVRDAEPAKRSTRSDAQLEEATFDAVEVDWTAIPAMVKEAASKMTFEKPVVTHISVNRFLPFDKNIQVRVFVVGDHDETGYADYDSKGHLQKVRSK